MNESNGDPRFKTQLRTMQVISAALLMGVCTFAAFVFFQGAARQNNPAQMPAGEVSPLPYLAAGALAVVGPLAFVVPGLVERSALKKIVAGTWVPRAENGSTWPQGQFDSDESKLVTVRQTSLIIGTALLEGTGFFGCVAYLISGQPLALGVVVAAIFLMLCKFPTAGRLQNWLESQTVQLTDLRREQDLTRQ